MSKVYIDCGAFNGRYIKRFKENPRYQGFTKFYAFECNPVMEMFNYGPNVETIRKAVWITDGQIPFYMNTNRPTIEGNSIYKDKTTGDLNKENPYIVPCIDFSKWLEHNFNESDYLLVKMNIEGAEYDVLEKCVLDGSIYLIDELHIQWHHKKIPMPTLRHESLKHVLSTINTLTLYNGYGQLNHKG